MEYLLVGILAGVGSLVRRNFTVFFRKKISQKNAFIATLIINLTGSFLIGFLFGKMKPQDLTYLILTTGFLGGLTTFSTFNSELVNLNFSERIKAFWWYYIMTYILGIVMVFFGFAMGNLSH